MLQYKELYTLYTKNKEHSSYIVLRSEAKANGKYSCLNKSEENARFFFLKQP